MVYFFFFWFLELFNPFFKAFIHVESSQPGLYISYTIPRSSGSLELHPDAWLQHENGRLGQLGHFLLQLHQATS